jgi:two-component system response regulator VanR
MNKDTFKNINMLYVEDDILVRESALPYFKRLFEKVYEASTTDEALTIIDKVKPLIVITDIELGSSSGLSMIRKARINNDQTQFIVLSAYTKKDYLLDAMDLGLVKYLSKPFDSDTLFPLLLKCKENLNLDRNEVKYLSKNCTYNLSSNQLIDNGITIKLTKNEDDFLHLLCEKYYSIVPYSELENRIWYNSIMSNDAIRSLVRNIRKLLPPNCIKNIAKTGYQIVLL